MKVLFVVLNNPEKLEDVLEGLVEAGVAGATVIDSVGMGHILEGVPLFAGLRYLFRGARPRNKTIFSVITDQQVDETMQILEKILGCAVPKREGIAFVLPAERVIGIC